jgi:manganese transport protein
VAAVIIILNGKLVFDVLTGWMNASEGAKTMIYLLVLPIILLLAGLLAWLIFAPTVRRLHEAAAVRRIPPQEAPSPVAYTRIGVALEQSALDEKILGHALGAAGSQKTPLVLLHVVESAGGRWLGAEAGDQETEDDAAYLERMAGQLREKGYAAEASLRFGDAAKELVAAVKEHKIDLLVMGAHGHRGVGDVVYGQTVDSVRHALKIPVLVVRSEDISQIK